MNTAPVFNSTLVTTISERAISHNCSLSKRTSFIKMNKQLCHFKSHAYLGFASPTTRSLILRLNLVLVLSSVREFELAEEGKELATFPGLLLGADT